MYFYRVGEVICCSWLQLDYPKADDKEQQHVRVFLYHREGTKARSSFLVNEPALLLQVQEGYRWLSSTALHEDKAVSEDVPTVVKEAIAAERLLAVNMAHPAFLEQLEAPFPRLKSKNVVHILALGDVGSHLLTGLHLLGGDCIERIGIFDLSEAMMKRWEIEQNQIAYPWQYDALPEVYCVQEEALFDCDVFIFAASASVPAVGEQVGDVRMIQLEKNSRIIAHYAKLARKAKFKGLFCEVSDPVDPLTQVAYFASNTDEEGNFDGQGLCPEQLQGYGLGVMNARAAYYAKRDERLADFLTEGRAFGPHGQELVIANSIEHYDDALSKQLTDLAVKANLVVRDLGFKPFVAPAYSSGVLSILETLRGHWHYGSVFLGGIYMGVKNRYTTQGLAHEILPLPKTLLERIKQAADALAEVTPS